MIKVGFTETNESINPFDGLSTTTKSSRNTIKDESGNLYEIPTIGYSKSFKKKGLNLKYNYESHELEVWDDEDIIYSREFKPSAWFSNPEKCAEELFNC